MKSSRSRRVSLVSIGVVTVLLLSGLEPEREAHALGPGFIQAAATTNESAATSMSQAFSSSNGVHDLIAVAVSWGTNATLTCSDSLANTYTVATTQYDSVNQQSLGICYAPNIKAGANTVTVKFSKSSPYRRVSVSEYSGVLTAAPVDTSVSNLATGSTATNAITSTAKTTTVGGDLIFGAAIDDTGTTSITAGTGFTQRSNVNNKDLATQDMVQASAGSVASTMTFGAAHRYVAQLVAFKTASSPDVTAPSVPAGLTAKPTSSTQITVSWTASTDNVAVTGYRVYRNLTQVATATSTTFTDTGLSAATTYSYTVAAIDAAGNISAQSSAALATTTAAPDVTPPSTPTGLTATATSQTRAQLNWTASTDNVAVTGYRIYRNTAQVGTVSATTTYADPALTAGTTYSYTVAAVDAAGNVSPQSTASVVTTPSPDTTPPSAPTGLAATATSQTQAQLSWTAATDNVAVTGYRIYRNTTQIGTVSATTTYADTGLSAGTTYSYTVAAIDAAGNVSAQSAAALATTTAAPDVTPPSTPTGLTATATSQTQVQLNWTASTDNVAVTSYRIYRDLTQVATATTTTYADTGLSAATTYSYTVAAIDAAGNISAQSAAALATTTAAPDVTPPSTPTGLTATATATSQSQVQLTWTASTDNVAVTSYRIYRNLTQVATATTTTYTDTGLSAGTTYSYTVAAIDAAGNISAQSTAALATTTAPDTTPPSAPTGLSATTTSQTQVQLTWTASTDDVAVTGYSIYRSTTDNFSPGTANQVGTSATTSYTDSGVNAGQFHYLVVAGDAAGNVSAASNQATVLIADSTPPSVPLNLTGAAVSPTQINLSWAPSTDNVSVASYSVYRNGTAIGAVSGTFYEDFIGLTPSTTYTYTVVAIDAANNASLPSAATAIATLPTPDPTPPSVPTNLQATAGSSVQMNLSWTPSTDNDTVAGYRIYRAGLQVGTSPSASYQDVGLAPATTYSYTVAAVDATGNVSAQSTVATGTTASLPVLPFLTSVSANNRYFLDQFGNPYLLHGDSSGQTIIGEFSIAQAETYFADRQAHGLNAVWINLTCTSITNYIGCNHDASTYDGIDPFLTPNDFSTPNPAYFQRAAAIITLAQQHGITVFLDPAEITGWLPQINSNGAAKDFAFGQFLGNYFKQFPNIVWFNGNDYQSWMNPTDDANVASIARGIQSVLPNSIQTVELNFYVSSSLDDAATWQSLIKLNGVYTYQPTYVEMLHAYNQTPIMPTAMIEANYEFDALYQQVPTTNETLRRQEYWTMTSGGAGQLYGNHYEWYSATATDELAHIDTPGVTEFQYATQLFNGLQWYNLVPDQTHNFLTAGYGTFSSALNGVTDGVMGSTYVTAATTPDGALGVVYVPATNTITLNLSQLSGAVTTRWFDPTTNTYLPAGNGFYGPLAGSQQFSTPTAAHSDGAHDWVLIATGNSTPDTTPPSAPTGLVVGGVTSTQVNLSWTASTDDVGVTGYKIYRGGTQVGTSMISSFTDIGLTPGVTYGYNVVAYDSSGNVSTPSLAAQATTLIPPPDTTPPSTPGSPSATAISTTQVNLAWTASTDNVGVVGYKIFRNGVQIAVTVSTSYPDNGLSPNTAYTYTVSAYDAAGNTASTATTVTTPAVSKVSFVQGAASSNDSNSTTISQPFSANVTLHDLIAVSVSWGNNATISCSDTLGNAYTVVTTQYDATNQQSLGICYAANSKAGADTVTVLFSKTAGYRHLSVSEYAGILTISPVDVSVTNLANGTTSANAITSTAKATTTAGDLIFGATMDDTGTTSIGAGAGFTQRTSVNGKDMVTQDLVQVSAGSVSSTMTFGAAHRYLAQLVAFKPAT